MGQASARRPKAGEVAEGGAAYQQGRQGIGGRGRGGRTARQPRLGGPRLLVGAAPTGRPACLTADGPTTGGAAEVRTVSASDGAAANDAMAGWPNCQIFEYSRNPSKVSNMSHFFNFFKNKEGHEFLPSLFQQREYCVLSGGAISAATVRVLFLASFLRGTCFRLTLAWFAVSLIRG